MSGPIKNYNLLIATTGVLTNIFKALATLSTKTTKRFTVRKEDLKPYLKSKSYHCDQQALLCKLLKDFANSRKESYMVAAFIHIPSQQAS